MIFPQTFEITTANDSTMGKKRSNMDKNFLNPDKFPQTASGRLDLFLCLGRAMQTSDFVAYCFPLNAVANY